MAKVIIKAQGTDGIMSLLEDRVVVERPGFFNLIKYGSNAKREIPLMAISEVVFKPANAFMPGEIELVRSGRSSDEKKTKNKANAVRFVKKNNQQFEDMKEKIFERMTQQNRSDNRG